MVSSNECVLGDHNWATHNTESGGRQTSDTRCTRCGVRHIITVHEISHQMVETTLRVIPASGGRAVSGEVVYFSVAVWNQTCQDLERDGFTVIRQTPEILGTVIPVYPTTLHVPHTTTSGGPGRGILVGLAVLVVGGLVWWGVGRSNDSPSTESQTYPPVYVAPSIVDPYLGAKAQAAAVNSILDSSAGSRAKLGAALADACGSPASALVQIRQVTAERSAQLDQASRLEVTALTDGQLIKNALVEALTHSLDSDREFDAWVSDNTCSHSDPHYQNAMAISESSTRAKNSFVAVWNPVASRFGLPIRSEDNI